MFKYDKLLGKGAYAIVVEGRNSKNQSFAIKKPFHPSSDLNKLVGIIALKELQIMATIKHPYIATASSVKFTDPCKTPFDSMTDSRFDQVFYIMPLADRSAYKWESSILDRKRALYQISCGLKFLHDRNISHRDIKPENIIIYQKEDHCVAKLCDFGMTKSMPPIARHSGHAGTTIYRAPEILMSEGRYNKKADIWSLACTFHYILCGKDIFNTSNAGNITEFVTSMITFFGSPKEYRKTLEQFNLHEKEAFPIEKVLKLDQKEFDSVDLFGKYKDFLSLMSKMLNPNFKERCSIDDIIEFFSDYKTDKFSIAPKKFEEKSIVKFFPAHHEHWSIGSNYFSKFKEIQIKFHALDIYNRYLCKIKSVDDKEFYEKAAIISYYIATKYNTEEKTDSIYKIDSNASNFFITSESIEKFERDIIIFLKCVIYEETVYDHCKIESDAEQIFEIYIKDSKLYGFDIKDVILEFYKNQQDNNDDQNKNDSSI